MKPAVLCFLVAVFCLAQTPSPPAAISAYYRLPGATSFPYQWLIIDPPLSLSFDGKSPHLSLAGPVANSGLSIETGCATGNCIALGTVTTLDIEPGTGTICVPQVSSGVMTFECSADPAKMAYRVAPPVASGPCVDPVDNLSYGAGAWAADGSYLYMCVPSGPTPPTGIIPPLVWARTGLATQW